MNPQYPEKTITRLSGRRLALQVTDLKRSGWTRNRTGDTSYRLIVFHIVLNCLEKELHVL